MKIPDISLDSLWRETDMKAKERLTRVVAQYVKQLQNRCSFDVVGNLYFREDLLDRKVCTLPTEDDKFVIGHIVAGLPRNLGPCSNDGGTWQHLQMQKLKIWSLYGYQRLRCTPTSTSAWPKK